MAATPSTSDAMAELKKMFKKESILREHVAKGMNLWSKKDVTVNGERIAKVDRVSAQLAKLLIQLRDGGVPLHHTICIGEFTKWARSLCFLADTFVSSPPVGVGIIFAIDKHNTAVVDSIIPGSPASTTAIMKGDELSRIDGEDWYRKDYLDMAQAYLGRIGTTVSLQFKRPDQPHPIVAKLRRSAGGKSEIQCDLDNALVVERVRFLEKSLLRLRFELEEWGLKAPGVRISEMNWHTSMVENELVGLHHRCLKLAKDLGLNVSIGRSSVEPDYDRNHVIRDPFAQMVWVGYFASAPCCKLRDFLAAVQNELRNLGFSLLKTAESVFLARMMGCSMEDCISQIDVQSFIDHWNPPPRWAEVESFAWDQRGHGLMDAFFLAKENLLEQPTDYTIPEWFHPFAPYQEACHLLSTADPGTFCIRYSESPGDFVIKWTSAGRQIKSAKVYVKKGGYAWRADGKIVYKSLKAMIKEVSLFLNKGLRFPKQRLTEPVELVGPDDD